MSKTDKDKRDRKQLSQNLESAVKLFETRTDEARNAMLAQLVEILVILQMSARARKIFKKITKATGKSRESLAKRLIRYACRNIKRSNLARYAKVIELAAQLELSGTETMRRLEVRGIAGFIESSGDPQIKARQSFQPTKTLLAAVRAETKQNKPVDIHMDVSGSKRRWSLMIGRFSRTSGMRIYKVVPLANREVAKVIRRYALE